MAGYGGTTRICRLEVQASFWRKQVRLVTESHNNSAFFSFRVETLHLSQGRRYLENSQSFVIWGSLTYMIRSIPFVLLRIKTRVAHHLRSSTREYQAYPHFGIILSPWTILGVDHWWEVDRVSCWYWCSYVRRPEPVNLIGDNLSTVHTYYGVTWMVRVSQGRWC